MSYCTTMLLLLTALLCPVISYAKANQVTTPQLLIAVNQLPLTQQQKLKPQYHPSIKPSAKRKHPVTYEQHLRHERLIHKPLKARRGQGSYWKWARHGAVPHGARIIRYENNQPLYGCHVKYKNQDYFGSVRHGGACVIRHNGADVKIDSYLVLMK